MKLYVLIAESWGLVAHDVAAAAVKRWRQEGKSPETYFLVTGDKACPRPPHLTEADFSADQLRRAGVPDDQIIFENWPSSNTRGQAEETKRLLGRGKKMEVVVFTSDLHAPRVAALFVNLDVRPANVVGVSYQADRGAPLSIFWMRFGRRGHSFFERQVAARRDLRNGWISKEQFRIIKKGEMPEGIALEIV